MVFIDGFWWTNIVANCAVLRVRERYIKLTGLFDYPKK